MQKLLSYPETDRINYLKNKRIKNINSIINMEWKKDNPDLFMITELEKERLILKKLKYGVGKI